LYFTNYQEVAKMAKMGIRLPTLQKNSASELALSDHNEQLHQIMES